MRHICEQEWLEQQPTDPTPITDGNGTIHRELTPGHGLTIEDSERLRFVILLSDMMTEENHALLSMSLPLSDNGP